MFNGVKFIVLVITFISLNILAQDIVRYNISEQFPDQKQDYYIDLLELILAESSKEFGDYQMIPVPIEMPQGRSSIMVEQNNSIDITWRMTSNDIEQRLNAIYLPLLKGIMGYRIFIIRKEDQILFSENMTLVELQQMLAGQGVDWPDSEILSFNKFKVLTGNATYMLTMLEKKRFDYFPRALHEPWIEVEDSTTLVVERHLMLKYPAPMFFFVSKENTKLKQRIDFGFKKIIESGLFDKFFYHHNVTSDILAKADINNRLVYELINPLLSDKTRALLLNKTLWLTE